MLALLLLTLTADPEPNRLVRTLSAPIPRHDDRAITVTYSPDGKRLATGGWDKMIRIWDAETGDLLHTWEAHDSAVWPTVFSGNGKFLASAGRDGKISLWEIASGEELQRFEGHTGGVYKLVWIREEGRLLSASFDKTVREWDITNGKQIRKREQLDEAHALALAPDRKTFAVASNRGFIGIYRRDDFSTVRTWQGHGDGIDHLAYSPDGTLLVSGSWDETAVVWNPADGANLRTLERHKTGVWPVVFSPDGSLLVSAGKDGYIRFWRPRTGELVREILAHSQGIPMVAFRPDGKVLASISWDSAVRQWDVTTGKPVGPVGGHLLHLHAVRPSNDGRSVLAFSQDQRLIRWDVASGRPVESHQIPGEHVAYGQIEGGRLLVGGRKVALYDTKTATLQRSFATPIRGSSLGAVAANGTLVAWGDGPTELVVSDAATGAERWRESFAEMLGLAFSPDAQMLAVVSGFDLLWLRTRDGRVVRRQSFAEPLSYRSVQFSPDGRLVAGISGNRLFAIDTLTGVERYSRPVALGRPFAFSPDGRNLYVAEASGRVRAWDLPRGVEWLDRPGRVENPSAVGVSADGRTLAVGSSKGEIDVWDIAPPPLVVLPRSEAEVKAAWEALAGLDPERVRRAMVALEESPAASLTLLGQRIRPSTAPADFERLPALIRKLDSDEFEDREAAQAALLRVGPRIEARLEQALREGPSPEARRRIGEIVTEFVNGRRSPDEVQVLRGIEVLERIGASDALRELSRGDSEAEPTLAAKAALGRLR